MYFFLFLFGLAIGSFLNVVSMRFKPEQGIFDFKIIGGRSHCPHCRKTLQWHELVPIFSFLFQKGKCRSCNNKLSFQYPIIEILTGLIFVFVPLLLINFQFSIYNFQSIFNLSILQLIIIALWLLVFILFLLLSIIDFRHYIIPDSINLSLAILGVILIIFNFQFSIFNQFSITQLSNSFLGHYAMLFNFWPLSVVNGQLSVVISHLFAALIAMAFYGLIIILSRGRGMGWGDFKLIGAIGLIFGWPDTLIISLLAFVIGSIFVAPLLIQKRKKMKDAVPFGPFIVAAAAVVFFFGFQLADAYFKFFNLFI
ncbi:prepilin peptidase [Candidatus Wolfebacteria bacterium]|nr:prepilin peptidase [Candidatus Wolfebacteria bacterium]